MNKKIAIFAPLAGNNLSADFSIKTKSNLQLTFKNIAFLAKNNFNDKLADSLSYEKKDSAAAGYYLEGHLKKNGYSATLFPNIDPVNLEILSKIDPLAICISTTMISTIIELKSIVLAIRRSYNDAFIIIGGCLVWKSYLFQAWYQKNVEDKDLYNKFNSDYNCFLLSSLIDVYVVSPFGSEELIKVLKQREKGKSADYANIPNLAYKSILGEFIFTHRNVYSYDYENDYTRWDLVDNLPYRIPLRSSVGCAFRCSFCDFWPLYPKLCMRSSTSLMSELSLIKNRIANSSHVPGFLFFTDDNILFNHKRAIEICNTLINSKINKLWGGFIRAESISHENISNLKNSGLSLALVGVESGDEGQLNRMEKNTSISMLKNGIELLDSVGIPSLMTFIVGFPGETEETISNTIDFISGIEQQCSLLSYQLYPFFLSPLSKINSSPLKENFNLTGSGYEWSHATLNSNNIPSYLLKIFNGVINVSYHYSLESYFYLKQFPGTILKQLIANRQALTCNIIQQKAWEISIPIYQRLFNLLGLSNEIPSADFHSSLNINYYQQK